MLNISDLEEDHQIEVIGNSAKRAAVTFVVENDMKADRYLRRLHKQFPTLRLFARYVLDEKIAVEVGEEKRRGQC